ncbi:hypothetical protein HYH03_009294 [Edaphochlamys debaryana]|uniref:BACK domain-containing protein n=1 Tax=Edaphochlamys debaryana TaxID=47281 RepID=A0A835XY60_9CHLO|nr:hypothetical protein HYH03_009294 [Edaphochlamys debaryana]|eukprot:KAG2492346.1 hypothetical protein HYH03_009294 [Edaphochlamys debaryana]
MPKGNQHVAAALAGLYGSEAGADCSIHFCLETSLAPTAGSKRPRDQEVPTEATTVGEPLPAHSLVLKHASERFAAQLDRWERRQESTPATGAACVSVRIAVLGEPSTQQGAPVARRPLLRVPLGSEAELPAARLVMKYAYTGEVEGLGSIREALEVRRIGDYLAIEGCAAACVKWVADKMAEAKVKTPNGKHAKAGSAARPAAAPEAKPGGQQAAAEPLVLQLYTCDALWPSDDPSFKTIIAATKPQLVRHFGSTLAALNTPSLRKQLLLLPAAGLEALLESDDLATDTEDSVLTLLAVWMEANWGRTDAATRKQLCGLVRLVQLSPHVSSGILMGLALDHETKGSAGGRTGWFACGVMEAARISACATANEGQRSLLDLRGTWYNTKARPQCVPVAGIAYPWSISTHALRAKLEGLQPDVLATVASSFDGFDPALPHVLTGGVALEVGVEYKHSNDAAGVFLFCSIPKAFKSPGSALEGARDCPATVSATLTVHRRSGGRREDGYSFTYDKKSGTRFASVGWGQAKGLALALPPTSGPNDGAGSSPNRDPLAGWAAYLHEGKITGYLTLKRLA